MSPPIAQARLSAFRLPLVRPWQFAGHRITGRGGWLLCIEDAAGNTGWGEATPFVQIGTERPERTLAWLSQALTSLPGRRVPQALADLEPPDTAPPAARCALECALLDLQARHQSLPLARLLHPDARQSVAVHATLGDLPSARADSLARAAAAGYRCVKLKLGVTAASRERLLLEHLLRQLPRGVKLRLDANRAWDPATARDLLSRLDPAHIDLVEEPLARGDVAAWRALQAVSPVPLALDESLEPRNLSEILHQRAARRLILKPMRLGGLLPCLDIARRARQAGMDCLVTSSLDGALATAAATHLAAAVDATGTTQIHGLATSQLLARDLAAALPVTRGHIALPDEPGLGLLPDTEIEETR